MKKYMTFIFSLILLSLTTGCITEEEPEIVSLSIGDPCPDFSIRLHDGSTISTSDLKGENSVIVFFHTSCKDCRAELPEVQKLYDEILQKNLKINLLCISRAQSAEEIEEYWSENNLTLPFSAQEDRKIYNLFASSIIPRIYIISPDLLISAQWTDNPLPSAEEILSKIE